VLGLAVALPSFLILTDLQWLELFCAGAWAGAELRFLLALHFILLDRF